jgi:molybdopterin/thiamine biosynthesis adenylyltransferase
MVGKSKVHSGKQFLGQLNSSIQVDIVQEKITNDLLAKLLPSVNVVLDCTDNFKTRQLINAACVHHQTPLVSGSALRFDGQVAVFDPRVPSSPCYACIFSPEEEFEEVSCSSMGIFSPLVGIIGAIQAAQALQVMIGFGESLLGRMLLWNARTTQIDQIKIARNPDCPVCASKRI